MTKIPSSIFYIESMRKTSEEFNCREAIENVKTICGNDTLEQLETIILKLVDRLLRMRSFEDSRVHRKYWKILIDGTQLSNDTNPLDKKCLIKTHCNKKDGSIRYIEYYYYVLEAKLVVKNNIMISIATEFVENSGKEEEIIGLESHAKSRIVEGEKATYRCNYVKGINYKGIMINVVKYEQSDKQYPYVFITDLPVNEKNQMKVVEDGRRRRRIEHEGFNTQKCHGYGLEHRFREKYNGMKNHYYLIQIGHMIAQLMENWKKLWESTRVSQGAKHKKLLESFKKIYLKEIYKEIQAIVLMWTFLQFQTDSFLKKCGTKFGKRII